MGGRKEQRRKDLKVKVEHVSATEGQRRLTGAYELILRAAVRADGQCSDIEEMCEDLETKCEPSEQE